MNSLRVLSRASALLLALLLLCTPATLSAQESSRALVGVVDIPALFRPLKGRRPAIELRSHPNAGGVAIATIRSADDVEAVGLGAGTLAATVYERLNRWSLLRLKGGRHGWLSPTDSGKFASLERVLSNNRDSTHLATWRGSGFSVSNGPWDRLLAPEPGSSDRVRIPRDPQRNIVGYLLPRRTAVERSYTAASREEAFLKERQIAASFPSATVRSTWGDGGDRYTAAILVGNRVPAYAEPDPTTPSVTELHTDSLNEVRTMAEELVPMFGSGPLIDRSRIPVFDRRPGWFQIRLAVAGSQSEWHEDQLVWVPESSTIWAFEEETNPDEAAARLRSVWFEDMPAVTIKGSRRINGKLWFQVDIWRGPACPSFPNQRVVGEGWIPAHDSRGRPTIWFETYCD